MTGRGLFIVSALARSWGIDDLPDGTRIWADFTGSAVGGARTARAGARRDRAGRGRRPSADTVIRLLGCPPDLLLAHDDNLADIARELSLFGASHSDPDAVAASRRRSSEVVRLSALSWARPGSVAKQALQEGRAASTSRSRRPTPTRSRCACRRCAGGRRAEAMAGQGC